MSAATMPTPVRDARMAGRMSRRRNTLDRVVKVLRMWTHYGK